MTTLAPQSMRHELLSEAIVAYLGLGTAPRPVRNIRAIEALSNDDDLIVATRATIHHALAFDTGDLEDLDAIEAAVAAHIRSLYPDLTARAVEAIVWNYNYGWR